MIGAQTTKHFRLLQRVGFARHQGRFMIVRQEYIHVRQEAIQARQVFPRSGYDHVQDGLGAALPGGGKHHDQLVLHYLGHH